MPDLIENEFNRKMLSIYLRSGGCNSSHRLKPPRLAKQGFVAGDAAAVAVAGRVVLGATCSAGRAKKAWGRGWEGVVAMKVAWVLK